MSIIILAIVMISLTRGVDGEDYYAPLNDSEAYFNQLILDIYVDETGKALVTGYVDDIQGLPFLQTAEYLFENDTLQLYALTNTLTWKYGDKWVLNLSVTGFYTYYHAIFYLPSDVSLGPITSSNNLEYLVSTSNDSFVIDMQGYDVESPSVMIDYQQPLAETDGGDSGEDFTSGYILLIIALSALILVLSIALSRTKRRDARHVEEPPQEKDKLEKTPEMARIMETLTDRERAIVNALLKHGGEMTQSDLRYETEIPKSSLTGILRTLERRQLIKKKEWGRTNVIALSEWFLSEKGGK